MGALIRISRVTKTYGAGPVLDDLSISVEEGEVLVLCGPSGCGKSTLLRCINGLETIQSGEIEVGGIRVDRAGPDELKQVRMATGLVFQQFNLFPHMTVLDNITIAPIKIRGAARKAAEAQAMALLDSVGIPEKAQVYPFQLSGGQRQRVAIARALAMEPRVMLFDEPTSALDPEMREEVLSVIRRVHAERGMTMVVVTHEIGFARAVASRAILMEAGRIVEEAPAATFFDNPASERTRRFVSAIKND
ncbi:MAG: amino acid ABC transporter ATP-binding protein [Thalassobaculales bacterium]